jgi:hypothetical protein
VDGFEEVGLADAVGAHDEHETGTQIQLEALVRAEVAERDRLDDQAVLALARAFSRGGGSA